MQKHCFGFPMNSKYESVSSTEDQELVHVSYFDKILLCGSHLRYHPSQAHP